LALITNSLAVTGVFSQFAMEVDAHPLWRCRLLRACELGHLRRDDFRYLFGQYYHYSRNFTRFLGALLSRCDDDLHRARIAQNLWEEGGMQKPETRHAEIFRDFLVRALGVAIDELRCEPFAAQFVDRYLGYCLEAPPASASAFLALGTEAVVARLYGVFVEGLLHAGIEERDLNFFRIHMECDDEHAATLADITDSYRHDPQWEILVRTGMRAALDERLQFFEHLFDGLRANRLARTLARVQQKSALAPARPEQDQVLFARSQQGQPLYANRIERLNVDFSVTRVPFQAEVLDPRLVRIPAGRANERHRHAHETVFYVVAGWGRLRVNEGMFAVSAGDIAFVPRWALHQVENLGETEMTILALTDFGFTSRAFVGDYDRTARLRRVEDDLTATLPVEGRL
jgi:pyrroloquinoline quinone (PQQ) biosynthesis protein C/quercetin dioxygenase-like cupin family protein